MCDVSVMSFSESVSELLSAGKRVEKMTRILKVKVQIRIIGALKKAICNILNRRLEVYCAG